MNSKMTLSTSYELQGSRQVHSKMTLCISNKLQGRRQVNRGILRISMQHSQERIAGPGVSGLVEYDPAHNVHCYQTLAIALPTWLWC